ncbi:MAG: ABC transporter permease, partial [Nitrospirae bacterium]|nr:ABC transporter permease [Nitrospirota bacterium]
IKGVKFVAPFMTNFGQTIIYGNKNMTAQVVGATELWAEAWKWPLADGEFLSEDDTSTLSKNCVIGQTIVKELFGDQSPVGETIRINDVNLKIIGVLGPRGSSPHGLDLDRRVVVPLSTAMKRLNNVNYIGNIRVYAEDPPLSRLYDDDPTRLRSITASIAELLRERHHITPPGEDDFRITDSISVAETVENVSGTMAKFLALLSLITLVVGGVVIANIMFVSVNERKQEIGIRRAFGARENDILSQFLAEVVVVTLLGGLIGAIAGFFIAEGISKAYDLPAIFSWEPLVIAVIASLVVGFTSGILPARKAAMLDPVTAIRG